MDLDTEHPSDDAIRAQLEAIKAAENTGASVGPRLPVADFLADAVGPLAAKAALFRAAHTSFRPIARDGNCFYRSWLVLIAERLAAYPDEAPAMCALLDKTLASLLTLGYPEFTLPDFHEALTALVRDAAGGDVDLVLEQHVRDPVASMYCITFLRCAVSCELLSHEEGYLPYVLGCSDHHSVKAFCEGEVEPVNCDADQLQITALAAAWGWS